MTTGNGQISGWAEKKRQSNSPVKLAPKVHGPVAVCCWSDYYSFLNPSEAKPLHLREVCSATNEMYPNLHVCSRHWSNRKAPVLDNNAPSHIAQPVLLNLNELGCNVCLISHSHLTSCLLTTTSPKI